MYTWNFKFLEQKRPTNILQIVDDDFDFQMDNYKASSWKIVTFIKIIIRLKKKTNTI